MIMKKYAEMTPEERIEYHEYQIKSIKDLYAEEQPKPWPQKGDEYWILNPYGVGTLEWDNDDGDKETIIRGIFRTQQEAEAADRQRIEETKVIRRLRELEPEGCEKTCFPLYSRGKLKTDSYALFGNKSHPPSWYSTNDAWMQVWKEDPGAVKTMLGVER